MSGSSPNLTVDCELAPILINRTAVYKICRDLPGELQSRGLNVRCSALWARLQSDSAEPTNRLQRGVFGLSRRWLLWALRHPRLFLSLRSVLHAPAGAFSSRRGVPLITDPLYLLFHPELRGGIVFVYDCTPVVTPAWHGAETARLYEAAFGMLARSACRIVAVSNNTADHLRVNWGIAPSRLHVLPLGLWEQPPGDPQEKRTEEPFLLFVGNLEPRKNILGLLQAYRQANLYTAHGVRLRIIGQICRPDDPILRTVSAVPGVDLLGFVDETTLANSYRDCLGFVYPSFCEGFGLPLLEAASHGCVCLAGSMGASPEVGGDAVLYADPYSSDSIAAGMLQLVTMSAEQRAEFQSRARSQSRRFTWKRFYDELAEVVRSEQQRMEQALGKLG